MLPGLKEIIVYWGSSFLGSVVFYTIIPLPLHWNLDFQRVARWATWIGCLIGALLSLVDLLFNQLGIPVFTRSALIVAVWLWLTGGLHFDGLIDTGDGLGVSESKRRLEVMQDSLVGAFGVMTAIAVLLLKTAALSEITHDRWFALIASAAWGRWGQMMAIALYPYLKPTGKGAFHRENFRFPQDLIVGSMIVLPLSFFTVENWQFCLIVIVGGMAIALLTGFWFYRRFGGHTGDTYGAVVEWTEALFLCLFTAIMDNG